MLGRVFVLMILRFWFYITLFLPKNHLILNKPNDCNFRKMVCKVDNMIKNYIIETNQGILFKQDSVFDKLSRANFTLNLLSPFVCFPKMQPCSFKRMKIIYILFIIDASHINWSFAFKLPKEIFMTSFIQKQIKIRWFMKVKSIMGLETRYAKLKCNI